MTSEVFHFSTLDELRIWLNQFKTTDLDIVHPLNSDYITLTWIERPLGDGSLVTDVHITTD